MAERASIVRWEWGTDACVCTPKDWFYQEAELFAGIITGEAMQYCGGTNAGGERNPFPCRERIVDAIFDETDHPFCEGNIHWILDSYNPPEEFIP